MKILMCQAFKLISKMKNKILNMQTKHNKKNASIKSIIIYLILMMVSKKDTHS